MKLAADALLVEVLEALEHHITEEELDLEQTMELRDKVRAHLVEAGVIADPDEEEPDPEANPENDLREALDAINATEKIEGRGASLLNDTRSMWVSGSPYLFSGFGERAFVFKNREQAAEILKNHAGLLKGFRVHVWGEA